MVDVIDKEVQLEEFAGINKKCGDAGEKEDNFERLTAAKAGEQREEKEVENRAGGADD